MIELVILIVAIILLYLLLPIVAAFMVLKYLFTGNKRMISVWFYRTARAIDIFANVNGADFFSAISSVLGKNQRDKTLSIAGEILRWMLDRIDKNHCLNSINDEATNTKKDISK